jgi:effector-binding domain-containing protein
MSDLLDLPPNDHALRVHLDPEVVRLSVRETAVIVAETTIKDLPQAIAEAIPAVATTVTKSGVALTGPPFVRYLAVGPAVRAEIGFPVGTAISPHGRVQPGRLPSGEAARIVHLGPYDTLAATYDRLLAWIAARGRAQAGPFWEVYWTDPDTSPDPATWRTEVFAPLRP